MAHIIHICPNCGRRFKCDRSTRTFEAQVPTLAPSTSAPWPNIQYEVYWGISKIADVFVKTIVVWIPASAIFYGISAYNSWSPAAPVIFCIASYPIILRAFGKVPSWHNAVSQTQPPDVHEIEPEPEDTRKFIGWESETHTKTTQHIEWYAPPVPIRQMQSYALALVNNRFDWIDERDLSNHKANISQLNYRKLRRDWLSRDWCTETGDRKTAIVNKTMIRRIAFDNPK